MTVESNKTQAAAEQAARNAQYAAHVAHTFFRFLVAHKNDAEGGITGNDANRSILERYIDDNLLDASEPQSWEIALLAMGSQLIRVQNPVLQPPASPTVEPPPTPVQLTEEQQLREIAKRFKGDPKGLANAMRARLKTNDARAKTAAQTLPAEYTRERIIKMPASEQRNLQQRFGVQALNDRLQGRN